MLPAAFSAADLEITVKNISSRKGEIGIALFSSPDGFPLNKGRAPGVWLPAEDERTAQLLKGLPPGNDAGAVAHDRKGTHQTETNWVGVPKEPRGVSNNVRPRLRAPKFEEAAITVVSDEPNRITINVSR
jgi:uncharacterized protein (DUF2141 family)